MGQEKLFSGTTLLGPLVVTAVGLGSLSPWTGGIPSVGLFGTVLGGATLVIQGLVVRGRLPESYARVAAVVLGVSVLSFVYLQVGAYQGTVHGTPGVHWLPLGVGTIPLVIGGGLSLIGGASASLAEGDWRLAEWHADRIALLAAGALAAASLLPLAKCSARLTPPDPGALGCFESFREGLGAQLVVVATILFLSVARFRQTGWSGRAATITAALGGLVVGAASMPLHSELVAMSEGAPFVGLPTAEVVAATVSYLAGATMVGVGLHDWLGRGDWRPRRALLIAAALLAGPTWPVIVGVPPGAILAHPLFVLLASVAAVIVAATLSRVLRQRRGSTAS